jgi:arylsulfatase A-like enzyme
LAVSREELFTPFIVSNPRLFPTPRQSFMVTNHLDIAPTIATLVGLEPPHDWLGRDMFAEQVPARLLFMQAKLAKVHAVLDNGIVYVLDTCRPRAKMFDISKGGFALVEDNDPRIVLREEYRRQDELFQKWTVWRHMARATGSEETQTVSTPRDVRARPAAALVVPSVSAGP